MTKCVNENCDYYNEHGECSSVCENNGFTKIFTNYDRIRNMSVEEMAEFLENTNSNCAIKLGDGYIVRDKLYIRIWLGAEVTE